MSAGKKPLPLNRKLFRVHWYYETEGGEWKLTKSVLLTESEAQSLADELQEARPVPLGRSDLRPVIRVDTKAAAEYEDERELRRKTAKGVKS